MKEVKIYHLRENWEDLVKGRGKMAYDEVLSLSIANCLEVCEYDIPTSDPKHDIFLINGYVFWGHDEISYFCYTTEEWRQIRLEKLI